MEQPRFNFKRFKFQGQSLNTEGQHPRTILIPWLLNESKRLEPSVANPSLVHTHKHFPLTCAHILCPLPNKAMGNMLNHYLNLPPSPQQSNGLHAKSWLKSSPALPYKAMGNMLSNYLNFPPSALQSNGLHAKSLFKSSPPLPHTAMISMQSQYLNLPSLCPAKQWATL